jgi:hypothetical protein
MSELVECPVCGEAGCSIEPPSKANPWERMFDCQRCGGFILSDVLKDGQLPGLSSRQRSILSHRLRLMQRGGAPLPNVQESLLPKVDDRLPSPAEQADNLILWTGDNQPSAMEFAQVSVPEISALIGSAIPTQNVPGNALTWLLDQDAVKGIVERRGPQKCEYLRLTMAGWERYEVLKRAVVESRRAFMAMQFGNDELDRVVKAYFKPAVRRGSRYITPPTATCPVDGKGSLSCRP